MDTKNEARRSGVATKRATIDLTSDAALGNTDAASDALGGTPNVTATLQPPPAAKKRKRIMTNLFKRGKNKEQTTKKQKAGPSFFFREDDPFRYWPGKMLEFTVCGKPQSQCRDKIGFNGARHNPSKQKQRGFANHSKHRNFRVP